MSEQNSPTSVSYSNEVHPHLNENPDITSVSDTISDDNSNDSDVDIMKKEIIRLQGEIRKKKIENEELLHIQENDRKLIAAAELQIHDLKKSSSAAMEKSIAMIKKLSADRDDIQRKLEDYESKEQALITTSNERVESLQKELATLREHFDRLKRSAKLQNTRLKEFFSLENDRMKIPLRYVPVLSVPLSTISSYPQGQTVFSGKECDWTLVLRWDSVKAGEIKSQDVDERTSNLMKSDEVPAHSNDTGESETVKFEWVLSSVLSNEWKDVTVSSSYFGLKPSKFDKATQLYFRESTRLRRKDVLTSTHNSVDLPDKVLDASNLLDFPNLVTALESYLLQDSVSIGDYSVFLPLLTHLAVRVQSDSLANSVENTKISVWECIDSFLQFFLLDVHRVFEESTRVLRNDLAREHVAASALSKQFAEFRERMEASTAHIFREEELSELKSNLLKEKQRAAVAENALTSLKTELEDQKKKYEAEFQVLQETYSSDLQEAKEQSVSLREHVSELEQQLSSLKSSLQKSGGDGLLKKDRAIVASEGPQEDSAFMDSQNRKRNQLLHRSRNQSLSSSASRSLYEVDELDLNLESPVDFASSSMRIDEESARMSRDSDHALSSIEDHLSSSAIAEKALDSPFPAPSDRKTLSAQAVLSKLMKTSDLAGFNGSSPQSPMSPSSDVTPSVVEERGYEKSRERNKLRSPKQYGKDIMNDVGERYNSYSVSRNRTESDTVFSVSASNTTRDKGYPLTGTLSHGQNTLFNYGNFEEDVLGEIDNFEHNNRLAVSLQQSRQKVVLLEQEVSSLRSLVSTLNKNIERLNLFSSLPTANETTTNTGNDNFTDISQSILDPSDSAVTSLPSKKKEENMPPIIRLEFLKNSVLQFATSKDPEDRSRILPVISRLLDLTEDEQNRAKMALEREKEEAEANRTYGLSNLISWYSRK